MQQAPEYPKRPPAFAHKFSRLLLRVCTAQDIGAEATLLLVAIVHCEDAKRYREPVMYWNDQLQSILGMSWGRLDRARRKAIDAGWLHYEGGGKGVVGRYWVTIPERFTGMGDGAADEDFVHQNGDTNPTLSLQNSDTNKDKADLSLQNGAPDGERTGGEPGDKCGKNRGTSAEHSSLTLDPNPSPKKKGAPIDEQLLALCQWWNGLHAEGVVVARVKAQDPSKAVRTGWARVARDDELRAMLADWDAIAVAIRGSPFVQNGWFRLETLLGAKNRDGELILRKLIEGGYRDTSPANQRGRVRHHDEPPVESIKV